MDNKRRTVIVSLDAVGRRDMEFMLTLPNFSRIVREGFFCDHVYSVYPSLTYPAHTSIVTGRVPNRHGIVNNTLFQPRRDNPDWMYKRKYIQGTTLYDLAHKKGLKTATLLWPVTGGAKVDYNIPEIMVTRKLQNQVISCLANGTPGYLLKLNSKFGKMRDGINQPALDDFLMASTEYTIRNYNPDLLMVHFTDVDTTRHNFGPEGPKVTEALKRHDKRLGDILKWLEETGDMKETSFIVLGDHCQIGADRIVYLNKLLKDKGFLTEKNGKITDYRAITKSCDGSSYLYINENYAGDEDFLESLTDLLNEIKSDPELGVEEIYTSEEAAEMGADENCFAMIEAKPGFYFLNETEKLTESVNETSNHKMLSIHGCSPEKEENITFFAGFGAGIKKGARVDSMHLWDEGPTIAKLMGLYIPDADGRVIKEMIE
ncbi:MAG: ectonucleotide pyrophosphatase/phosphodiesterase [Lachnospiraceae bacterium]|nr:ectonucleotide pyrophosphatase/phosphodiesterase [Lachnospiraceae bacterium]